MNVVKCKRCGSHPVIEFSSFTGLIEVYCHCKKNVFVGYGNTQQEAVEEWNKENKN